MATADKCSKNIGLKIEGTKCCVLRETLSAKIWNQLLFEVDYKNKSSSYKRHKEKLMQLFPSSSNNLVQLLTFSQLNKSEKGFKSWLWKLGQGFSNYKAETSFNFKIFRLYKNNSFAHNTPEANLKTSFQSYTVNYGHCGKN